MASIAQKPEEIIYKTDYTVMGRAKGTITDAQLIAIKTYLEMGLNAGKISKLTGVPRDSIYKLNKGKFGHLKDVASDPEIKKHWNEKRKQFIDDAYKKVEMMLGTIDVEKATSANLKDTVTSIAALVQQIVNMVGSVRQTSEITEEVGIVRNMDDTSLDSFINSAANALGANGGVVLRRTVKQTIEESQGSADASGVNDTSGFGIEAGEDGIRPGGDGIDELGIEAGADESLDWEGIESELGTGNRGYPVGQDGTPGSECTRGSGSPEIEDPNGDRGAGRDSIETVDTSSERGDTGTEVLKEPRRVDGGAKRGEDSRSPEEITTLDQQRSSMGLPEKTAAHSESESATTSGSEVQEDSRDKFRSIVGVITSGTTHPLDIEPVDPASDGRGCNPVYEVVGSDGAKEASCASDGRTVKTKGAQ